MIFGAAIGKISEKPTEKLLKGIADISPEGWFTKGLSGRQKFETRYKQQLSRLANKRTPFNIAVLKNYKKTILNGLIGGYAGGFVENTVSGVFDAVKEKIKL